MHHSISHDENIHRKERGRYLGDLVYGANDGIITTFAVVSGAMGAMLTPSIIIILGLANLIGDGISMGLSNLLSIRSRREFEQSQRKIEEHEIVVYPEREREETRAILEKTWGIPQEHIETTLDVITKDKKRWVDLMMRDELGILESPDGNP